MHTEIFRRIANREKPWRYIRAADVVNIFAGFLAEHKYINPIYVYPKPNAEKDQITVAGKNFFCFDNRFLENDKWHDNPWFEFHRRSLDPAQMYFDPSVDDELPNLKKCLSQIGINKEISHTAIEDAMDVVKLIRAYYEPKYKE